MTAGERLVYLSGMSGATTAQMLRRIGGQAAKTTGAALVAYSGLATGTAAQHLLTNRVMGGGGPTPYRYPWDNADKEHSNWQRRRLLDDDETLLAAVAALVAARRLH